jgi:hypothetical protein
MEAYHSTALTFIAILAPPASPPLPMKRFLPAIELF